MNYDVYIKRTGIKRIKETFSKKLDNILWNIDYVKNDSVDSYIITECDLLSKEATELKKWYSKYTTKAHMSDLGVDISIVDNKLIKLLTKLPVDTYEYRLCLIAGDFRVYKIKDDVC